MEKKYTITLRLSYQQHAWLGVLCRRSKQTQSEVIRSLIENGSVRERITQEHIHIIRQLIGESTNLNQLARQANTYGFFAVADRCEEMAQSITKLSMESPTNHEFCYARKEIFEVCIKYAGLTHVYHGVILDTFL